MVSGNPTSTNIPQVDGLSTDTPVLGRHMCIYLKGCKLWLYVSGDRPIPEKVDKETNSAYAIQIEDWESANHHIITWFRNTSIPSIVDEFGNIDIAKEF